MKRLYMLCGAMGVGKTATGLALRDSLPDCAFLDGDWCWDMHPFRVTETTSAWCWTTSAALNNFLTCGAFENVVFFWVMHRREILDGILRRLDARGWEVRPVALFARGARWPSRRGCDGGEGGRGQPRARPCVPAALRRLGPATARHFVFAAPAAALRILIRMFEG